MSRERRDHLEMLCSVGELSARLVGSADVEAFLRELVDMLAGHMHSDVCSIYLYEEDAGELVLRATHGLAADSIGRVRMALGEGLVGLALKEHRPIREDYASRNPHFKAFDGINEEPYESFLAVPIRRGIERIGVLVVQREERDFFDDEDVQALRATASQLAGAIENARLLIHLRDRAPEAQTTDAPPTLVKGRLASEGFACAPATVVDPARDRRLFAADAFGDTCTADDFHDALDATQRQLRELQEHLSERLPEMASMIFDAHLMMLKDPAFVAEIVERIDAGANPPRAVIDVGRRYMDMFAGSPHAYMREKAQDVEDLVRRLVANLTGRSPGVEAGGRRIVVARELYPSDVLKLAGEQVCGLVLVSGGVTSHVSILARSLHVPLVIADDPRLLDLPEGALVLLDGKLGNIYVNPTEDVVERFRARNEAEASVEAADVEVHDETRSADGVRVRLLANVNLLSDCPAARRVKAEGVGLYRSEFPFLVRTGLPSEEEQMVIYRRLLDEMPAREVTFRTLDVGSDKLPSYYDQSDEENPALGLRSIRFSLRHPDVFDQQLRAILRAAAEAESLRIMFPMISSVEEFAEAKDAVRRTIRELRRENHALHERPALGVMVEVPAAVSIVEQLADEADFLCVGTNDLIQFLLAVDRTNEKVAPYFAPHHPAVLAALARVATAGAERGREVSVCGEMASDERFVGFLLGVGVRALSVDPQHIPRLQRRIEGTSVEDAKRGAADLLREHRMDAIAAKLDG